MTTDSFILLNKCSDSDLSLTFLPISGQIVSGVVLLFITLLFQVSLDYLMFSTY